MERVSAAVSDSDAISYKLFYDELITRRFIPAGNTLLAGVEQIAPNCAILGLLTEQNFAEKFELSKKLWLGKTGIGFNLSGLDDPVDALRKLSRANDAIDLVHRPKRGNMAVLNASHPRIKEFVTCKSRGNDIYNFNISVAVDTETLADDLLDCIAESAWRTGDPGLIFLARGANYGPNSAAAASPDIEPIVTCVPCGEQFMHAFETCNLGSINLNADTLMDASGRSIDMDKLAQTVKIAICFLDRVVDHLQFPDEQLKRVALDMRRIGLGVMGWADLLKRSNVFYNSAEALALARKLSLFISRTAEQESEKLATMYGRCAYSDKHRNISMTCIAPTGGITGLTSNQGYSIEPYFSEATSYTYKEHIDMQVAWQAGIHNAVSKTVNLPASATVSTVRAVYKYAIKSGCKGVTLYRDSSKDNQPRKLTACADCVDSLCGLQTQ